MKFSFAVTKPIKVGKRLSYFKEQIGVRIEFKLFLRLNWFAKKVFLSKLFEQETLKEIKLFNKPNQLSKTETFLSKLFTAMNISKL